MVKPANVNDIGDGMSFQRAELGNGSRKCLGIAEYLADPDRVVLSVILKIHDLASAQEVTARNGCAAAHSVREADPQAG
jgi:hypothetical protein